VEKDYSGPVTGCEVMNFDSINFAEAGFDRTGVSLAHGCNRRGQKKAEEEKAGQRSGLAFQIHSHRFSPRLLILAPGDLDSETAWSIPDYIVQNAACQSSRL
jgi:hypothetical protein